MLKPTHSNQRMFQDWNLFPRSLCIFDMANINILIIKNDVSYPTCARSPINITNFCISADILDFYHLSRIL